MCRSSWIICFISWYSTILPHGKKENKKKLDFSKYRQGTWWFPCWGVKFSIYLELRRVIFISFLLQLTPSVLRLWLSLIFFILNPCRGLCTSCLPPLHFSTVLPLLWPRDIFSSIWVLLSPYQLEHILDFTVHGSEKSSTSGYTSLSRLCWL